jgi:ABC-type nitrate/sulfonate/bicarbonate transport system permease component
MASPGKKFLLLDSKWAVRLLSIVIVLVSWQIYGSFYPIIAASPLAVVSGFFFLLRTNFPLNFSYELAVTLWTFFVGYVIAVLVGIGIAIVLARWKTIETALDPYITALYNAPYVALAPLFMVMFGVDFTARIVVVLLSVVFVIIINAVAGFKNASRALVETGRSFGFSGPKLYSKLTLPAAFPFIITGMRLGIGRGLVGVIVAESVVQIISIGYLLQYYQEALNRIDLELAIVLVITIIALVLTEGLKYAERSLSKWRVVTS